jgi:hypothetical protein
LNIITSSDSSKSLNSISSTETLLSHSSNPLNLSTSDSTTSLTQFSSLNSPTASSYRTFPSSQFSTPELGKKQYSTLKYNGDICPSTLLQKSSSNSRIPLGSGNPNPSNSGFSIYSNPGSAGFFIFYFKFYFSLFT